MDNDTSSKTAQEYFDFIKSKKNTIDDELLNALYDNSLILLNKYNITGQIAAMKKLIFQIETIEKEREIVKLGINTFVYKDDIEYYIDVVRRNVVKIIELERYEREIPDNIVDLISKTRHIFDKFYIVFTDYTGKIERQVEKERRDKDPILFGTFQNSETRLIIDRFYYIGDWVDDFCDLTLDKMISETERKTGKNIEMKISTPKDIEELKEQISKLESKNDSYVINNNMKKIKKEKLFFNKIRSVFRNET